MLTLFGIDRPGAMPRPLAQVAGGTLAPLSIRKFATPLVLVPVMPRAASLPSHEGNVDYYEISLRQLTQQVLPAELPPTTVWGYGSAGSGLHGAPSPTIEATWNTPTRIKWINDLKDGAGHYLPHLFPVDQTIHWADPAGESSGHHSHPGSSASTPGPYLGPVPMVTHLHGAVAVGEESDGYPDAWYLPDAHDIPSGYSPAGPWYRYFRDRAAAKGYVAPGQAQWQPGTAVFQYPNTQRASTIWYHDHVIGITRLSIYAGAAGFFLILGGPEGDDAVLDSRTRTRAGLPAYEIPIVIQDRSFNADGSLFYPDTRAFFDGITGPHVPQSDVPPVWNPEFFGNAIVVNGNTWPYLEVAQRRYRFRFLNACNTRFLILDFARIPGIEAWMVGNDGGFLEAPVKLAGDVKLLLGPAERADVIVDFGQVARGDHVLFNIGPDEPFRRFHFPAADPETTGQVLQFRVGPATAADPSTPPEHLVLPPLAPPLAQDDDRGLRRPDAPLPDDCLSPAASASPNCGAGETTLRRLALIEEMSMHVEGAPVRAMFATPSEEAGGGSDWTPRRFADPVTENPAVGATEAWDFYNLTGHAHPMHIHDVAFEVVGRRLVPFGETETEFEPPEPSERGFKDTVIAYPFEITRVRMQFPVAGRFTWHCHILEHEDNEMMRPFHVGPLQEEG